MSHISVHNAAIGATPERKTAWFDLNQPRNLLIAAIVLAVLLTTLFWSYIETQIISAFNNPADWGHTLAIPFISGYFVWFKREELLRTPFVTTWLGLVPVVLGVGFFVLSSVGPVTLEHHNFRGFSFALTIFGIFFLLCGYKAMRYLWFPVAYFCVFGQTVSQSLMDRITFVLQDITAFGSYLFLNVLQIDTTLSGNVLTLFHQGKEIPLNIAEACSGMRMLVAFLALGTAVAYTGLPRLWQQITLVLLGVPVAIFVNILRVLTLSLLSMADSNFAAGDFHSFVGLLWLVPALLMFLGLQWILRNIVIEEDDNRLTNKPAAGKPTAGGAT